MYTVGFYVDDDEEDRVRRVTVRVKGPGLRAIHPAKYLFRSPSERKTSLLRAAWAAPEMFQTGIVRAHVFPLRPSGKSAWNALLAVSFPVPLADIEAPSTKREFGAVISRGSRVVHRFNRRITLSPDSPDVTSEPQITFLEPVDLRPGAYTITAVLADPDDVDPDAARVTVEVPEIPQRELFLVGPVLGRRSGPNLVVTGGGSRGVDDEIGAENSFEPLMVQRIGGPTDLVALTQACLVGPKNPSRKRLEMQRALRNEQDEAIGDLPPVEFALDGEDRIHCGNLVDVLPAASVQPGEYEFEVVLDPSRHATTSTIRFAVDAP